MPIVAVSLYNKGLVGHCSALLAPLLISLESGGFPVVLLGSSNNIFHVFVAFFSRKYCYDFGAVLVGICTHCTFIEEKEDKIVALVFMTFTTERDEHCEVLTSCGTAVVTSTSFPPLGLCSDGSAEGWVQCKHPRIILRPAKILHQPQFCPKTSKSSAKWTPLQQVQASPADFLFKFHLLQWCPLSWGCVCWPLALNSCATGVAVFGNSTFCFGAGVWRLDEIPMTPAGSAPCLCDWPGVIYSCLKAYCPMNPLFLFASLAPVTRIEWWLQCCCKELPLPEHQLLLCHSQQRARVIKMPMSQPFRANSV